MRLLVCPEMGCVVVSHRDEQVAERVEYQHSDVRVVCLGWRCAKEDLRCWC